MIHGMCLIRNESSRNICGTKIFYKFVEQMNKLCDTVTYIDDNSTDDTFEELEREKIKAGSRIETIIKNSERKWNVNEVELRKQLWNETIKNANHDDWIICLDADELFQRNHLPYIEYLLKSLSTQIDAIGFKLYDMWNLSQYRFDQYWQAHFHNWPMAIRYKTDREYKWSDKPLHCGRFPLNAGKQMLPTQIPLRHYGWADEEDRKAKYDRYMSIDPEGKNGILAQYKSILDTNPNLVDFGRCCID